MDILRKLIVREEEERKDDGDVQENGDGKGQNQVPVARLHGHGTNTC
jgi:hypothetical protein